MGAKKALVIGSDGLIQQLQSGDYLTVPFSGVDLITQTNDEAGAIVIGTPVYNDGNDTVKKAKADASGTSKCVGLVYDASITNGVAGSIATNGILTATTVQWDAVAGTTGGLTAGTYYFVSPATAGQLTATVTTTAGQYNVRVGMGISTTELKVDIKDRILL